MHRLLKGALVLGGGAAAAEALRRSLKDSSDPRYESWEREPYRDFPKRILILGGGFAGYTAAKSLCKMTRGRDDVGVMVISRDNYFTFWPMLAGCISSDIDSNNVAQPLRRALIRLGASFRRAEVESVDFEKQCVTAEGREFPYDHLVLALGAEPAYFGIPGVEQHAISIKGIGAAERIRNRVIERYEEATLSRGEIPDSRLTFVVIGGGATGVEVASELHELVHNVLAPDYPNIDPNRVRIILVDSNEQVLKELDPALRRTARKKLADLRISVFNNVKAHEITAEKVILSDGHEIVTENAIWTAGARASEKLDDLNLPSDERKGLVTDKYLRVEGHERVWGIGDCAMTIEEDGTSVPPNAQAAVQEGKTVARNILAAIDGKELRPFDYKPVGQLVEMGSQFAVNEVMGVKFSGLLAALFWRATYLYKLESPQSRARIATDWVLDLFFTPAVTQIQDRR
ncbi:MAG TPA: NAD(P)/FAD-dependent oxidoreductase [Rubrobacteraceae bacterium]|nr:NAD(P)/FAD-dependent oxidoreductase [Rubrobacteraceae bacterium]